MDTRGEASARPVPIPSTLLRRLAEAVDCSAPNTAVWVVARRAFPHQVELVTPDQAEARRRAAELGDHEVFGPYVNQPVETQQLEPPVQAPASHLMAKPCYHRATTSEWVCSGATHEVTARVEITVRNRDGEVVTVPHHDIDAVTFGFPAFEKFVVPYLYRVYGIAEAYRRWKEMRQHR